MSNKAILPWAAASLGFCCGERPGDAQAGDVIVFVIVVLFVWLVTHDVGIIWPGVSPDLCSHQLF